MFAVKAKIYAVSIINPALSLLMKHLVTGKHQKAPNFSFFFAEEKSVINHRSFQNVTRFGVSVDEAYILLAT